MIAERFVCGPLDVTIRCSLPAIARKVRETIELHDVPWAPTRPVTIEATACAPGHQSTASGDYLRCARMNVDATPTGLVASTLSGAHATGELGPPDHWHFEVPLDADGQPPVDVEDLTQLVVTTGWRRAGWVPMHLGTIVRDGVCALVCAPSGGGKSTFVASALRRGWRTLGDDKVLLGVTAEGPVAQGLVHTFNLHPSTVDWLPEVGDLNRLPRYSVWTDKRKVRPVEVWGEVTEVRRRPTHLIALERSASADGVALEPLGAEEVVPRLLRQTVVPTARDDAARLLQVLAAVAPTLRPALLTVGDDAYRRPDALDPIDELLS